MKARFWSFVAIAMLVLPISAQATLIGAYEGTWADDGDSEFPRNFGVFELVFNSTSGTPTGSVVGGLLSFICTGGDMPEDECGILDAPFTGSLVNATSQFELQLEGVVLTGIVSGDFNAISGSYIGDGGEVHGAFRASRVTSVPEPATLTLLLAGLATLGAARRRRQYENTR